MLDSLKPYPAYKESGVPWLGRVPEHWEIRRMKTVLRELSEKGFPDEPLLAATQSRGVVRKESYESRTVLALKDLHLLKLVRKDDFVISLRSFQGGIEYARDQGIISPAYTILRARELPAHPYLARLFKSQPFIQQLGLYVTGIRQGQTIEYEKLGRAPIPLPPLEDIGTIVRYLDSADRRIRRYIGTRQRLIKLLEEQKRSVFNLAITRGLESSPRTRPSGLVWIRDAPEGWERIRLKALTEAIVDCLHATPVYSPVGEFPAIRTADITPGRIDLDRARRVDAEHYRLWTARMAPAEGEILYSREGERFGIAAQVPGEVKLCISQRMMAIRVHARANARFVMWQLNCDHVYAQAAVDLIGSAAPHVNVERVRNFELLLPPRREQDRIVEWIDQRIENTEGSIRRVRQEILLMKELRTRLIADVVTGRLDVTEAASALQLEPEAAETSAADDIEEIDVTSEEDGDEASAEAEA